MNSLHEIAFRIGRRLGGEDPQLADATIFFQGWWLKSKAQASLYRSAATNAVGFPLKPGMLMLVAAPQMKDDWVYVYDPADRQRGFVRTADVEETSEQPDAQNDPALADLLLPLGQRSLSVRVSLAIRFVTWLVFGAAFFWLVCRTRSVVEVPAKCLILLVFAFYLVASWFWPWYVLWALPVAAVAPSGLLPESLAKVGRGVPTAPFGSQQTRRGAVGTPRPTTFTLTRMLTIQLSVTVLWLYALSDSAWTYSWRAAFVFGLPLLGTAIICLIARARRDSSARCH